MGAMDRAAMAFEGLCERHPWAVGLPLWLLMGLLCSCDWAEVLL